MDREFLQVVYDTRHSVVPLPRTAEALLADLPLGARDVAQAAATIAAPPKLQAPPAPP